MIAGAKESDWMVRNPWRPGRHIAACLEASDDYPGMSVSEAARKLGVSRYRFFRVLHGRGPVTLDLALKMEALGWVTADLWLEMQTRYDLAQARKRLNRPLSAAPAVRRKNELLAEADAAAAAA